jgi:hypothetical protein
MATFVTEHTLKSWLGELIHEAKQEIVVAYPHSEIKQAFLEQLLVKALSSNIKVVIIYNNQQIINAVHTIRENPVYFQFPNVEIRLVSKLFYSYFGNEKRFMISIIDQEGLCGNAKFGWLLDKNERDDEIAASAYEYLADVLTKSDLFYKAP